MLCYQLIGYELIWWQ